MAKIVIRIFLLVTSLGLATTAYADSHARTEIIPIIPHAGLVRSIAFSSDGKQTLSAADGAVKLWETSTGRLLRTFVGPQVDGDFIALSSDKKLIAVGGGDRLKLWDALTGKLLHTLGEPIDQISATAFSGNNEQVFASVADDNVETVEAWRVKTGGLVRKFKVHCEKDADASAAAFSPDGTWFAVGCGSGMIRVWDVKTGKALHSFKGKKRITALAISLDGSKILSGTGVRRRKGSKDTSTHSVELWDAMSGRVKNLADQLDSIESVCFSRDGHLAAAGSGDQIMIWQTRGGKLLRTVKAADITVDSVVLSPDGSLAVSASSANVAKLWNTSTGEFLRSFGVAAMEVEAVAFAPKGNRVLVGRAKGINSDQLFDDKGFAEYRDLSSGQVLRTLHSGITDITSVNFSRDGDRVLLAGHENLELWNLTTGQIENRFEQYSSLGAILSPDGRQALSVDAAGSVTIFDAQSGKLLRKFREHATRLSAASFSADGTRVLVAVEGALELWDIVTGQLMQKVDTHQSLSEHSIALSPDGTLLLSGGVDGIVGKLKLWDASRGDLVRSIPFETDFFRVGVRAVAFSADGLRVAAGNEDGKIGIWERSTGQLLRELRGHAAEVTSVAFSPDGRRIISGSLDRTIRVWDLDRSAQLVSMIATADDEWIAMTPSGFFTASGRGGQTLGIVRGLAAYDINQMYQALYNPDLVREVLAGDPDEEAKKAAAVVDLDKVLDSGSAPEIEVESASHGSETREELVSVSVRISDKGGGVGRIEWRVNGITAAIGHAPVGGGRVFGVAQNLALDPGENTIEVVAYNGRNLLASSPARTIIKYMGSADATGPKLHILAIGINAYVDKGWNERGRIRRGFPPLSLAVKDAESFAAEMKRAGGSLYQDIIITSVPDKEATRDNLDKVVDRIAKDIHPRDTFIFFAAAHGTSENGRFYLIPQDYQGGPGALQERAIGQDVLQDWLANRIKAKKALILLDTCESGALVAGYLQSRTEEAASEAGVGRLHEATGRPVLTAAATGQFAHEGVVTDSGERHGVFTWALLDALHNGDTNGDGKIELSELVAHVQDKVPELAAKYGGVARAETVTPRRGGQTARFGSRGEDFVVVSRLQ